MLFFFVPSDINTYFINLVDSVSLIIHIIHISREIIINQIIKVSLNIKYCLITKNSTVIVTLKIQHIKNDQNRYARNIYRL